MLAPGGRLLLTTPAHGRLRLLLHGVERYSEPQGDHLHLYTARSLRTLLDEFGFADIRVGGGQRAAVAPSYPERTSRRRGSRVKQAPMRSSSCTQTRPFLSCLFAGLAALAPAGASAFQKAVWGPANYRGVNQFPLYKTLGVDIYEMSLDWNTVAPHKPQHPSEPDDPAYQLAGAPDQRDRRGRANTGCGC